MAAHVMQHADPPTWCVHCGIFDCYAVGECDAEPSGRYDSNQSENYRRMLESMFGKGVTQ